MAKQYKTDPAGPVHYINGKLIEPGDVVTLPKGVKPGTYLKPVDANEAVEPEGGGNAGDGQSIA